MGKAQYLLQRDVGREEADIQKKYKKRGLWSKIGMGLGGLLAMGLTAGTAAPLVAGLMSAGGTYIGGKLGDILARQSGARIKGKGKFFQDQREDIVGRIGEDILAGSLTSGLTAGMTQWGAGLKFGKEGLSMSLPGVGAQATKEGVTKTAGLKFGDIFKPKGGFTKDTLMGRLGESLNPRIGESFIGKGVSGLKSKMLEKQFIEKGWIDPNLQKNYLEGGKPIVAMDRRIHSPAAKSARIDAMLQERGPLGKAPSIEDVRASASGPGFQKGVLPGHSKIQYDVSQAKSAELSEVLGRKGGGYQFGPLDGAPQPTSTKPLSSTLDWREASARGEISQTTDAGSFGGDVKRHFGTGSGQSVAAERGERSAFSQALDAEDITPLELSGRPSIDLPERPSRRLPSQRISSMEYGGVVPGYEPTSYGPGTDETGAIFSDENMWANTDPGSSNMSLRDLTTAKRNLMAARPEGAISRSGIAGSGVDFTGTSAWEGAGESFPVTSPDMVGDIGEAYTQSPEYDYKSVLDKKRQGRLETLQWQDRLFGR